MVSELQILAAAAKITTVMTSINNPSVTYSNVKVSLFEGENYDFWTVKMETLFTSLDVLEYVKNGYEEPAPTKAEKSKEKAEESSQQLEEQHHRCWSSRDDSKRGLSIHLPKDYES